MRSKTILAGGIGVVIGVLLTAAVALAGNLNPITGPTDAASQMYTLNQIYDRLTSGAAGSKMTTFTEPAAAPGSTMHTMDELMSKAPTLDAVNGATTAEVQAGKTFWGLTEGAWGLQTGTATMGTTYEAGVPATGQTTCYAADDSSAIIDCSGTGQDGDYQTGVAWPDPRFTNNNDGTVTDNLTGLVWLRNANCGGTRLWDGALAFCNALYDGWTGDGSGGDCGLTDGSSVGDWRLPNLREMQSLIDYGRAYPALPSSHPFMDLQQQAYWTSSTHMWNRNYAWYVLPGDGHIWYYRKVTGYNYVWPVRDAQ